MIRNVYVNTNNVPRLIDLAIKLGLDATGDIIQVDTDKRIVYRYPLGLKGGQPLEISDDDTWVTIISCMIMANGLDDLKSEFPNDLDEFIVLLKAIELIDDSTISGLGYEIETDDIEDSLNEGETLNDLLTGEVTHYNRKVNAGTKYITSDVISSLAIDYLITDGGGVNYKNKKIITTAGFRVYPGEADSFGWLTGIIELKKGLIVFG